MPASPTHRGAFRACGALLLAAILTLVLAFAATAGADTTFGGNPNQQVFPGATCSLGAPLYPPALGAYPGTEGSQSCMWGWSNPAVGTDIAPIPATGGSGTVTSVTLPAMANPGPMQVVVLTAGLSAGSVPSKPDYVCCQVKQVGPTFTVPANQVATVPQSLHVSATEEANLSIPGDTSFGDQLAVSVLSPDRVVADPLHRPRRRTEHHRLRRRLRLLPGADRSQRRVPQPVRHLRLPDARQLHTSRTGPARRRPPPARAEAEAG